jgi:hypothetical protein
MNNQMVILKEIGEEIVVPIPRLSRTTADPLSHKDKGS